MNSSRIFFAGAVLWISAAVLLLHSTQGQPTSTNLKKIASKKPKSARKSNHHRQRQCPLFCLPGELRNQIYRLVLVRSGGDREIEYSPSGYQRPALVNTCKVIRHETREIFYQENTFFTIVHNFNSDHMLRFEQQLRHQRTVGIDAFCGVDYTQASWPNLMMWLRRYHLDEVFDAPDTPDQLLELGIGRESMVEYVIGGMFRTVEAIEGEPWEKVEKVLSGWRPALISRDRRWKDD